MKIKFLADHVDYKKGDVVSDYPNAEYLVTMGVAKEYKEEKKQVKPTKKAVKKAEPSKKEKVKVKGKKATRK